MVEALKDEEKTNFWSWLDDTIVSTDSALQKANNLTDTIDTFKTKWEKITSGGAGASIRNASTRTGGSASAGVLLPLIAGGVLLAKFIF